jgi:putative OPT family oligopeptide transporter
MSPFDQTRAPQFTPQAAPYQFTLRAIVLGGLLSVVLAGANAYLGLFAGLTVSASIPAAVVSMAVLRWFRNVHVLEHNIVQTAASAGEAIAAGAIFTLPALVLMEYWRDFHGPWVILLCGVGGLLGVLFTIPLRHALVVEQNLPFPEGAATATVLQAGSAGATGRGIGVLLAGALGGAFVKLGETGLKLWSGSIGQAFSAGPAVFSLGSSLSPALLAVGYIVGLNIALLIFMGGLFAWGVAIPLHSWLLPVSAVPDASPADVAWQLWSTRIRYLGVGAMLVGGMWALWSMRSALVAGFGRTSLKGSAETERDLPRPLLVSMLVLLVVPMYLFYRHLLESSTVAIPLTAVMLAAAFVFSAVAAYMAGLVGSSNNPISGLTIATILFTAFVLLLLLGKVPAGPVGAILVGAVVCCAAAIGGDTLQDLKAGAILGASPWKQQVAQMLGVVCAVFVLAPIMSLLLHAYGIGGAPTAEHPAPLAAPQANLMAAVARGVFGEDLPWGLVGLGALLGVFIILCDELLRVRGSAFRMPVLAVAVGIYLPMELSAPIALGGFVAWWSGQRSGASGPGMLAAAGLITGEALMGIAMAVPIVLTGNPDVLKVAGGSWGSLPGVFLIAALSLWMARLRAGTQAG